MSTHPSGNVLSGLLLLIGRLGLAAVFGVHGVQKLMAGIPATTAGFTQMGIPYPEIAAWFSISVEIGGAVLLVLGALTRVAGLLLAADMLGALFLVHLPNGFFITDGGYEFVLALAAASIALAGSGAGRLSIDGWARGRRHRSVETRRDASGSAATSTPGSGDSSSWQRSTS